MPHPAIPEPLSKVAVDLGFRAAPDPLARGTWGESQLMKMERWLDKLAYHLKRGRCFAHEEFPGEFASFAQPFLEEHLAS